MEPTVVQKRLQEVTTTHCVIIHKSAVLFSGQAVLCAVETEVLSISLDSSYSSGGYTGLHFIFLWTAIRRRKQNYVLTCGIKNVHATTSCRVRPASQLIRSQEERNELELSKASHVRIQGNCIVERHVRTRRLCYEYNTNRRFAALSCPLTTTNSTPPQSQNAYARQSQCAICFDY